MNIKKGFFLVLLIIYISSSVLADDPTIARGDPDDQDYIFIDNGVSIDFTGTIQSNDDGDLSVNLLKAGSDDSISFGDPASQKEDSQQFFGSGNFQSFDLSLFQDDTDGVFEGPGEFGYELVWNDADGTNTVIDTRDEEFYVYSGEPSITSPSSGSTLETSDVNFDITALAGHGCSEISLYVDSSIQNTWSPNDVFFTRDVYEGNTVTQQIDGQNVDLEVVDVTGDESADIRVDGESFSVTEGDIIDRTGSNQNIRITKITNDDNGGDLLSNYNSVVFEGWFEDSYTVQGLSDGSHDASLELDCETEAENTFTTTEKDSMSFDVDLNSPPSANFTFAPESPDTLENISFTDESTDPDGDGTITKWEWSFGDGTTKTITSSPGDVNHSYSSAGNYTVSLNVTDDAGESDIVQKEISLDSDAEQTTLTPNYPQNGQVYTQESVEYNYSLDGNSGSVEIYRNGTKIHNDSYNGSGSQIFNYSENLPTGAYDYYLKYVGDDGSTKSSSTRDFTVDAPLTSSISLDTPADAKDFKNTFPINVNYAFQVSGEPGTVELFRDGNVVKTYTHPEGQNVDYSYSESFSQEGNHTWYVKYTRDSDSQTKTSLTREYSIIQQESVSLSIQSPSDGATFEYDETVKFDYSASSNVIGTVELLLNGSSVNSNNYASPGNTKFYSYEASDLSGDPYNARVRFTSDDGNTHFSNYVNFSVKDSPVTYIEDIQVKYRGVDSGSVDKSILVNLTGNTSIDSHGSVSGDTATFNDDKWVIENISIPYQDDLVVYDTQGRNDTRSLDLDVSVKSVAGHPENANLSYQEKNRTLSVQNNGATFDFNYSCSSNAYGNPANVDDIGQVMSGSSSDFACRWSGDWLNHSSGQFDPTVSSVDIDDLLPMESWIEINNSESVSFPSVKYPEVVPDPTCSTSKPASVGNNSQVNKTAEIDCDIGDSGDPTLTIDGTDYKWNTTLNLSSDLTENITLTWDTNKSKLSDWSNKDPGSSIAYFKGISDDILLAESTSSVKIIVPDGTFTGGVGEGLHPARIEYTVGASSGSSGGTGGSSGGSTPRIIRNITGTYNWSVSAPRSQGQTFYNVVGWGGRDLGNAPTRIVVRNLGTGNFTLEARCVSDDNSCEFIELSQKNISLDELENDRQVVQVEGVIPQEIPEDGYRFNIVFEDPEGQELETNFRINKNYAQSLIIRFISKVFGVKEIDFDGDGGGRPVPVPLALPVFLITGFFWGAVSLFIRFAQSNNMLRDGMDFTRGRLIASMLVFILAFIFI